MPKNNKLSSGNNSLAKPLQTIITIVIIILAVAYFAYNLDTTQINPQPVPAVEGTSTTTPSSVPQPKEIPSNFEVYFTNPVRPFPGNTEDSIEYRLIEKINNAKVSLHGAFFEFDLESVAQALIKAHNRGVEVELVYDNEHTDSDPQMKEMIKAGIKAVPDERSAFMHNKFMVVDNQCVWTGSFNLTVNAAYKNNENAFYLCDPALAENYQLEFSEMFNGQFGPSSPSNTPNSEIKIGDVTLQNYFAPENNVMPKVIEAVNKAQTSIHFLTFSFTDEALADAMLARKSNGVKISGIFESRGASAESSECVNLFISGADIHLDGNPYTLHDKIIIIDGEVVIFGSFNFSANANDSNDENLIILYSSELAQKYEQEFQKLLAESITPTASCKAP